MQARVLIFYVHVKYISKTMYRLSLMNCTPKTLMTYHHMSNDRREGQSFIFFNVAPKSPRSCSRISSRILAEWPQHDFLKLSMLSLWPSKDNILRFLLIMNYVETT